MKLEINNEIYLSTLSIKLTVFLQQKNIAVPLEILYQDDYLVIINKPHGLLVHQSAIARDAKEFALQLLRDQIGKWVAPVHRLDRKTSGILIFALDKLTEKLMSEAFAQKLIEKKYIAIVRGYTPDEGEIDYPLRKENGTLQDAFTKYKTLDRAEIQKGLGKHLTQRYSLVEAMPTTGRMHQLRKHFAHINHPIIGDRPHGCNKQNKFFLENYNMNTMLLHASNIQFKHPHKQQKIIVNANISKEFERIFTLLNFSFVLNSA